MRLSQKCQYALLALVELARLRTENPVSIQSLGESQGIPPLFLQTIFRELKQGGFVEGRRGKEGGYRLARGADRVTVGQVIRFFEGGISPAPTPAKAEGRNLALDALWREAERRLGDLVDRATLADLVVRERQLAGATEQYEI